MSTVETRVDPIRLTPAQQEAYDRCRAAILRGDPADREDIVAAGLLDWWREHSQAQQWREARLATKGDPFVPSGSRLSEDQQVELLNKTWLDQIASRRRARQDWETSQETIEAIKAEQKRVIHFDWRSVRLDTIETVGQLVEAIDRVRDPDNRYTPEMLDLQAKRGQASGKHAAAQRLLVSTRDWRLERKAEGLHRMAQAAAEAADAERAADFSREAEALSTNWLDPEAAFGLFCKPTPLVTHDASTPRG